MSLPPLAVGPILSAVLSHAQTLGLFDRTIPFEPKSAPGKGMTCAVWLHRLTPVPAASGLNRTAVRLEATVRLYTPMLAEPQDAIEARLLGAVDRLMAAYSGDFDLGDLIRNVDLLGQHGVPLDATTGYVEMDSSLYRVATITLPMIINDLWQQAA